MVTEQGMVDRIIKSVKGIDETGRIALKLQVGNVLQKILYAPFGGQILLIYSVSPISCVRIGKMVITQDEKEFVERIMLNNTYYFFK